MLRARQNILANELVEIYNGLVVKASPLTATELLVREQARQAREKIENDFCSYDYLIPNSGHFHMQSPGYKTGPLEIENDDKMYSFLGRNKFIYEDDEMGCKNEEYCLTETQKVCIDSMVQNGETLGTMTFVIYQPNGYEGRDYSIEKYVQIRRVRTAIQKYIDGE